MTEWISVDDRLPEHMQEVSVKGHFQDEMDCKFLKTAFGNSFIKSFNNAGYKVEICYVTHWMPLKEQGI